MTTPTILRFEWPEGTDPLLIEEVEAYLREQNLAGMRISRPMGEPEPGSMAVGDFLPVIEVLLNSTVNVTLVGGLFGLIKKVIDSQMHKRTVNADREKNRLADAQVTRAVNADLEKNRLADAQVTRAVNADLEKARIADAQVTRTVNADLEKARIAAGQIRCSVEKPGEEKLSLDLNPTDPDESERYSSLIDQACQSQA